MQHTNHFNNREPDSPTPNSISRRDALKRLGSAGASAVLTRSVIRGQNTDIIVSGQPMGIAIFPVSPSTVRITVLPVGNGGLTGVPDDGAIAKGGEGGIPTRQSSSDRFDAVRSGNLIVRFRPDPPTLHIDSRKGKTVQRLTLNAKAAGMAFLLSQGPLFGLGQGGPQFDRKGSTDRMRSGQAGYRLATNGGRVPIQWLVGADGWGMFLHQHLGSFDFTGPQARFTPAGEGLPLDIFIVFSTSPPEIMREYARITGLAEMPPLWALGYMQSHRTLAGPEEVLGVAKTMRDKRLPCDALIYLGNEFTPSGWNTRNGEFAWNKANFPDPKDMIARLHAEHFRVVLHIVIEGRHLSGTVEVRLACSKETRSITFDGRPLNVVLSR